MSGSLPMDGSQPHGHQPQQAASATSAPHERKLMRDTLYSGIFNRHRRTIFAIGSFLRMLRNKKSNYNAIKQDNDDTD